MNPSELEEFKQQVATEEVHFLGLVNDSFENLNPVCLDAMRVVDSPKYLAIQRVVRPTLLYLQHKTKLVEFLGEEFQKIDVIMEKLPSAAIVEIIKEFLKDPVNEITLKDDGSIAQVSYSSQRDWADEEVLQAFATILEDKIPEHVVKAVNARGGHSRASGKLDTK